MPRTADKILRLPLCDVNPEKLCWMAIDRSRGIATTRHIFNRAVWIADIEIAFAITANRGIKMIPECRSNACEAAGIWNLRNE